MISTSFHLKAKFKYFFRWTVLTFDNTLLVVVLPDPFRGMGARRNSTETFNSRATPEDLD